MQIASSTAIHTEPDTSSHPRRPILKGTHQPVHTGVSRETIYALRTCRSALLHPPTGTRSNLPDHHARIGAIRNLTCLSSRVQYLRIRQSCRLVLKQAVRTVVPGSARAIRFEYGHAPKTNPAIFQTPDRVLPSGSRKLFDGRRCRVSISFST